MKKFSQAPSREDVLIFLPNINVDGIVSVRAADILPEGEGKHLRMLAQVPVVSFIPCKACAVNPGLLAGADPDYLAVLGVTDRIGLRIF